MKHVWPYPTASSHSLRGSFSTPLLEELKPFLQPGVAHGKFIYSLLFLPASPLNLNSSSPSLVLTPDVFIESNQICAQSQANQAHVSPLRRPFQSPALRRSLKGWQGLPRGFRAGAVPVCAWLPWDDCAHPGCGAAFWLVISRVQSVVRPVLFLL